MNNMKLKKLVLAAVALIIGIALTSCNQNNPSEADLFVGKYVGVVTYANPGAVVPSITRTKGTVTVVKVGNTYSFNFSDGIPSITGITMAKGQSSEFQLGGDATGYIRVKGTDLNIYYISKEKGAWTATAKRM